MPLKGNWTNKVDGVDDVLAEHINQIASAVILLEDEFGSVESSLDAIIQIQENLIGDNNE
jgi:hypothetical protein